jgi:Ulp1 family protease
MEGLASSPGLDELRREKAELSVKCDDLEEKLSSLQSSVSELMERVKTTQSLESRINVIETKLSVAKSDNTNSDDDEKDEGKISIFKERTLERLTAIENRVHDLANKVVGGETDKEKHDKTASEKKIKSEKDDPSSCAVTYCQYPPNFSGNISVTNEDYMCLAASQFLNDVIIDFFLKYLQYSNNGTVDQDLMAKTHIFTTFFYKRLTTKPLTPKGSKSHPIEDDPDLTDSQKMYERVRKWTKKVDLFKRISSLSQSMRKHIGMFV